MQFRVLGSVEVLTDDGRVLTLPRRHERCVLAILLIEAGRPVSSHRLIDLLWEGNPPGQPLQGLRIYIARIRSVLAQAGGADGPEVTVASRRQSYVLNVDPDVVDVHRFRRLLAAAGTTGPAERDRLLRAALALWRGPAMGDDAPDRLRQRVCADLDELRLHAVEELMATGLELGRHRELLPELARLTAGNRVRDRLVELHMLALYRLGRTADALEVYRVARTTLADDFGLDPGPALQDLHRSILRGDPGLLTAGPAAAPAPTRVTPAQLPAEPAGFAGRAEYLRRLDALLSDEPATVVISAIAGTAGVGKTALALHWAHRVRDRFPDGQLYVNLRGYAAGPPMRPVDALAGFLSALGVPAGDVPTDIEQAAGLYRSLLADKRVLVLLDNAASAEQVRPLLPAAAGCLVVVTSRDRLGGLVAQEGAHRVSLDVLRPDEADAVLAGIVGADRVAAEPDAAAALASACAFLPLALRVAAANLVNHPRGRIADLVHELTPGAARLAALHVDGDDQTAVRAAFDLSYTSLGPDERRMFRLFGLFPGTDLTAATAAALAGATAPGSARLLDRLAAAHLLTEHGPGRYSSHDLLRDYAAERSRCDDSAPDRAAATDRLYEYYVRAARAASALVRPDLVRLPVDPPLREHDLFDGVDEALSWLDAERSNLVAAVVHAASHGPYAAAAHLADALYGYLSLRLAMLDWYTVAHAGRSAARTAGDERAEAAAELGLAAADAFQDKQGQAAAHCERALTVARSAGWGPGQAAALINLGNVRWRTGHLAAAADHFHETFTVWERLADPRGQTAALNNLGQVHYDQGDLHRSVDHYNQALALSRRTGVRRHEALVHLGLGHTYHALGCFADAMEHLDHARTLNQKTSNRWHEAVALCWLAEVHRDAGRYDEALRLIRTALDLVADTAPGRRQPEGLNILASVHRLRGDHGAADTQHRNALLLAGEIQARRPEIEAHLGLAASPADHATARTHADRALTLADESGYRVHCARARTALAGIDLATSHPERALHHAREALTVHRDTGHRLGTARTHLVLGRAYRDTGQPDDAHAHWREALALFTDIGAPEARTVRELLAHTIPGMHTR